MAFIPIHLRPEFAPRVAEKINPADVLAEIRHILDSESRFSYHLHTRDERRGIRNLLVVRAGRGSYEQKQTKARTAVRLTVANGSAPDPITDARCDSRKTNEGKGTNCPGWYGSV